MSQTADNANQEKLDQLICDMKRLQQVKRNKTQKKEKNRQEKVVLESEWSQREIEKKNEEKLQSIKDIVDVIFDLVICDSNIRVFREYDYEFMQIRKSW